MTSILDFAALDATPLVHDPFDHLILPAFIKAGALPAINRDFPALRNPGNYAVEKLAYGAAFQALLCTLNGPELAQRMSAKFGVDLIGYPTTITIREYCEPSDGNIHTDHRSKIITILLYFNTNWMHEGGKLRLLRSAHNIEDYATEIEPVGGTLLAFRRSDRSFHGHKPFTGERRILQMSWLKPDPLAQYKQRLDRFSTHLIKRVSRLI
jgi:hypothetical protein